MTKGALNRLIREHTRTVVARLPITLKPKETRLIEAAVKEVVQQLAEDIQRLDNPQFVDAQEKLDKVKALWKEINKQLL